MEQKHADQIARRLEPGNWTTHRDEKTGKHYTIWANGYFAETCPIHTRSQLPCYFCETWEQREQDAETAADASKQEAGVL